jgi:hypothetical protein
MEVIVPNEKLYEYRKTTTGLDDILPLVVWAPNADTTTFLSVGRFTGPINPNQ